jgi:hypothetical protein
VVVYAKRPFAGPEQALDYLGRYTHRVALSIASWITTTAASDFGGETMPITTA